MNAIETHALTRRFGAHTAVDGLDLTVRQGELFALLGVNGAGKTTTLRMLSGLLQPTGGEADILGFRLRLLHDLLGLGTGLGDDLLRFGLGVGDQLVGLGTAFLQPLVVELFGQLLKFVFHSVI